MKRWLMRGAGVGAIAAGLALLFLAWWEAPAGGGTWDDGFHPL